LRKFTEQWWHYTRARHEDPPPCVLLCFGNSENRK